jgi:hypothetical protein
MKRRTLGQSAVLTARGGGRLDERITGETSALKRGEGGWGRGGESVDGGGPGGKEILREGEMAKLSQAGRIRLGGVGREK